MNSTSSRIALVTGASSGIGKASAEALARTGFTVFGTSRRPSGGSPEDVTMLACDVTDDASVAALVKTILERAGRIDVLVNNAGLGMFGGAEESSVAQVQQLFDVNLFGVMRMTNAVLPSMRLQRAGRIVNISSALGFVPAPYSAHYAASKYALCSKQIRTRRIFGIARPRSPGVQRARGLDRTGHRPGLVRP